MRQRTIVAVISGIACAIVAGIYGYVIAVQGLNIYSTSMPSLVNELFWRCGEVYGVCQSELLKQADAARSIRDNVHPTALSIGGFSAGLFLLGVPAVILGLSSRRLARQTKPLQSMVGLRTASQREILDELERLDEMRKRGEITYEGLQERRKEVVRRARKISSVS